MHTWLAVRAMGLSSGPRKPKRGGAASGPRREWSAQSKKVVFVCLTEEPARHDSGVEEASRHQIRRPPVMDYDKPRGAPTGGVELTEKERQALDMYVITPRALPGVMHIIDMQDKVDALTAFHEKGSVVEPFEDAISGGPFGNQHGFTCEDLCRKQAGSAFGQLALRRLL